MQSPGRRHGRATAPPRTTPATGAVNRDDGARASTRGKKTFSSPSSASSPFSSPPNEPGKSIPTFIIDLDEAASRRYVQAAAHFRAELHRSDLPGLFEDLVASLAGGRRGAFSNGIIWLARRALRRVFDAEETAELKGIARQTGVEMHLLVAFNVLLDLLLGCTSGGVRVSEDDSNLPPFIVGDRDGSMTSKTAGSGVGAGDRRGGGTGVGGPRSRMLHFRTLDWGMDVLRRLVVQLDFVKGGGPVLASVVTYFGYVGVLTGARKGLTMSLNFRPHHCRDTFMQRARFRLHQALVVLGFRRSISSALRRILLDPQPTPGITPIPAGGSLAGEHMAAILRELSSSSGTAAYLIMCTPQRVYVVEKDHGSAAIRDSDTFLTAYNHDFADEDGRSAHLAAAARELAGNNGEDIIGMSELVEYSLDRKRHLDRKYARRVKSCRRMIGRGLDRDVVTSQDVMDFLRDKEIRNEETHYAAIMDPLTGSILWKRAFI